MDTIDGLALAFVLLIGLGLLVALAFYVRSSYRDGGWPRVRRDLMLAVGAVTLAIVIPLVKERAYPFLERFLDRWVGR